MSAPLPYGYSLVPSWTPSYVPPPGFGVSVDAQGQMVQYPITNYDPNALAIAQSVLGTNASNPNPTATGNNGILGTGSLPTLDPGSLPGLSGWLNNWLYNAGQSARAGSGLPSQVSSGGFFNFISDIPRVGTFFLALIIVAAGFFLLGKGPVQREFIKSIGAVG